MDFISWKQINVHTNLIVYIRDMFEASLNSSLKQFLQLSLSVPVLYQEMISRAIYLREGKMKTRALILVVSILV
jgi:hypothetical protein